MLFIALYHAFLLFSIDFQIEAPLSQHRKLYNKPYGSGYMKKEQPWRLLLLCVKLLDKRKYISLVHCFLSFSRKSLNILLFSKSLMMCFGSRDLHCCSSAHKKAWCSKLIFTDSVCVSHRYTINKSGISPSKIAI